MRNGSCTSGSDLKGRAPAQPVRGKHVAAAHALNRDVRHPLLLAAHLDRHRLPEAEAAEVTLAAGHARLSAGRCNPYCSALCRMASFALQMRLKTHSSRHFHTRLIPKQRRGCKVNFWRNEVMADYAKL